MLEILTIIMGILMSIAYFPQAYKIYKNKSSHDVSIISYIIFSIGTFIWTWYGFFINDFVIIFGFIIGVVGSWLVLGLALYYRHKNTSAVEQEQC